MSTPLIFVLYHGSCDDGFGAAWACWLKLRGAATYVPAQYGVPPPEMPSESTVFILDFSYPRATVEWLHERHRGQVTLLDHHRTAREELAGLDYCLIDENHSGAILAWHFFHGADKEPPTLLLRIEDRDLWRKAMPDADEFTAWLRSWPQDFHVWRRLSYEVDRDAVTWPTEGAALLRYQRQTVALHADQAVWVELAGHKVPVAPAPINLRSEVPTLLLERFPEAPFAAAYYDRADGARTWSLRSRPGFDVSRIARQYEWRGQRGGGHPQAAGFQTESPGTGGIAV